MTTAVIGKKKKNPKDKADRKNPRRAAKTLGALFIIFFGKFVILKISFTSHETGLKEIFSKILNEKSNKAKAKNHIFCVKTNKRINVKITEAVILLTFSFICSEEIGHTN